MYNAFMKSMRIREHGIYSFDIKHVMVTRLKSLYQQSWLPPVSPAYTCQYYGNQTTSLVAVGYENGIARFRKTFIEKPEDISYQIHRNVIFDLSWLKDDLKIVTGSGDQTSILYDVQTITPIRRYKAHTGSVRRVASHPDSPQRFATGGRDGNVVTWDTRAAGPDDQILGAHLSATGNASSSSIMDVKYLDGNHLITCGNADCAIKIWDLRKTHAIAKQATHCFKVENPNPNKIFFNLVVDAQTSIFYATSSCNKIFCYKTESLKPEGWFEGAEVGGSFIRACLSPNGDYLLSGGLDHCAYIWPTKQCGTQCVTPLVRLVGHSQAVTAVAWADVKREPVILTCSDDFKEYLWTPVDRAMHLMLEADDNYKMGCAEVIKPPTAAQKFVGSVLTAVKINTHRPGETTPIKGMASMSLSQASTSTSSIPDFLQNLPNFLVDGNSPHNKVNREQVSVKENIDWLTQMQKSSGSKEKSRVPKSSGRKRPHPSGTDKKRKGKSLLKYFPKVRKTE